MILCWYWLYHCYIHGYFASIKHELIYIDSTLRTYVMRRGATPAEASRSIRAEWASLFLDDGSRVLNSPWYLAWRAPITWSLRTTRFVFIRPQYWRWREARQRYFGRTITARLSYWYCAIYFVAVFDIRGSFQSSFSTVPHYTRYLICAQEANYIYTLAARLMLMPPPDKTLAICQLTDYFIRFYDAEASPTAIAVPSPKKSQMLPASEWCYELLHCSYLTGSRLRGRWYNTCMMIRGRFKVLYRQPPAEAVRFIDAMFTCLIHGELAITYGFRHDADMRQSKILFTSYGVYNADMPPVDATTISVPPPPLRGTLTIRLY